jgi:hypothetical protein
VKSAKLFTFPELDKFYPHILRDGPFDFSWGGGANPKKNIEHVSNGRKKNRTSLTPAKKNIEHKKILN